MWAEGKLSELGAPPSGGRPSSTGRWRPTSILIAKLTPIETGPSAAATSHWSRLPESISAITTPIASQTAPYSPMQAEAAADRLGPGPVEAGPHRVQQAVVEPGEHGGAG